MSRVALITGIIGQDGSYLAELLLKQGYRVHGADVQTSGEALDRVRHLLDRVVVHAADLTDQSSLRNLIDRVRPTEVYNLAAQSSVALSWQQPARTGDVTALGVARLLEVIREVDRSIRFFQASSSEIFGGTSETPQCETTPLNPASPYGVAKAYGHWLTACYREAHGMFACSGVLYNHESPRRALGFVTRKITHGAARIKAGLDNELRLGNLEPERDWGFAGDYVEAMWRMLQQEQPDDYVIGTGEAHSVREFVEVAFDHVGLDWQTYVTVDPKFYRPAEANRLLADSSKARRELGWRPRLEFAELVRSMVDADLALLSRAKAA